MQTHIKNKNIQSINICTAQNHSALEQLSKQVEYHMSEISGVNHHNDMQHQEENVFYEGKIFPIIERHLLI